MSNNLLAVNLVIFVACFTQGLTGFGLGLVTMSMLPALIGLHSATPFVALTGVVLELIMLIRYRESLQFKSIAKLLSASVLAIPVGVFILGRVDEKLALFTLGAITTAYALYALIGFRLPELQHPIWAWIFGAAGGLLGGAYNTSGPPVILYGNCRRWMPFEFKSNLAGYFLVISSMAASAHWVTGNLTPGVVSYFLSTSPALLLGFLLSQYMDRWLNPELFRRIVLVLLVLLGIRLML
ncbi:MAG TPA: sulfite exporter TauE/SafE family protein [Anaerolineales bacterium]|nr:sulfite exporter TauE/SafE family protein [Anaerolineales bacterium]